MGDNDNDCAICTHVPNWSVILMPAEKLQSVAKRGIANMVKISNMLQDAFDKYIQNEDTITVHSKCRLRYIKQYIPNMPAKKRKLSDDTNNQKDSMDSEIANLNDSTLTTNSIDGSESDNLYTSDADYFIE